MKKVNLISGDITDFSCWCYGEFS